MRLHQISLFLMLALGAAGAYADPGYARRDAREAVRAYQIQSVTLERSAPRNPTQVVPQERRRQDGMPESSGYGGSAGDAQSNSSQQAENMRRQQGRMTPEERRALRRQIDEAGHDIYSPKR